MDTRTTIERVEEEDGIVTDDSRLDSSNVGLADDVIPDAPGSLLFEEASASIPPPPIGVLSRGRNLDDSFSSEEETSIPPPPPLMGLLTRDTHLGDESVVSEESSIPPPPPPFGVLVRGRTLDTSSSSSEEEEEIPPPPVSALARGRTLPPPPVSPSHLQRRTSSQQRVSLSTAIDVDAFIGEDTTSSSSEGEEEGRAESLIEHMRFATATNSADVDDKSDEKLAATGGGVEVLTEEELPAIVTPELRRHSSSPGAYHAGGIGGGGIVSPERLNPTTSLSPPSLRETVSSPDQLPSSLPLQIDNEAPPSPPALTESESCTTLVSATLVDECSETEQSNSVPPLSPGGMAHLPFAHAEPMNKRPMSKRKRVHCFAAWIVSCAVVVLIFSFLGSLVVRVLSPDSNGSSPTSVDGIPVNQSSAPTPVPLIDGSMYVDLQTSSHVVMWGQVTTCNDTEFFTSFPLELQCGGFINIVDSVNADCNQVLLAGYDIPDKSRMDCRFEQPDEPIVDGEVFYQEANAHIIYTCQGETLGDHSGTATLPEMTVTGCANPKEPRRLLRSTTATVHTSSSPTSGRSRALQEVRRGGGASSFISTGRFCSENEGTDWVLWHQFYKCERGDRDFFTIFGDMLSAPPPSDVESFMKWIDSLEFFTLGEGSGSGTSNGILVDFVASILDPSNDENGGGRRLDSTSYDWLLGLLDLAGVKNFCYEVDSCNDSASCIANIGSVQVSDWDRRTACRQNDEGPPLRVMKRLIDDHMASDEFVDRISELI